MYTPTMGGVNRLDPYLTSWGETNARMDLSYLTLVTITGDLSVRNVGSCLG